MLRFSINKNIFSSLNLSTLSLSMNPVSILKNFKLHLEQAFVGKAKSQAVSMNSLALKGWVLHRAHDFAPGADNVADIGYAADLQRASETGYIRIEVLSHSFNSFPGSTKRSLNTRSNIDHGWLQACSSLCSLVSDSFLGTINLNMYKW